MNINDKVEQGKLEIIEDVLAGDVPEDVESFSDLHDFVDANAYADGFTHPDVPEDDPTHEATMEQWIKELNEVQETLDKWIKDGGLKVAVAEARKG